MGTLSTGEALCALYSAQGASAHSIKDLTTLIWVLKVHGLLLEGYGETGRYQDL